MVQENADRGGQLGRDCLLALCEAALAELLAERAAAQTEVARRDLNAQIVTMREIVRGLAKHSGG